MTKTSLWHTTGMVALVATMVLLSGCGKDAPEVTIPTLPEATTERVVEPPPEATPETVRWPLTGLPADGASAVGVRAVSVKVENSFAAWPQSSLQSADIVYETLTEANITRFNVIFHSQAPEVVGPVRSARLSDVYLVPQYDAFFAHVGGSESVLAAVKSADIDDLDQFTNSGPYWRSSDRRAPHNMYTHIGELRELGADKGFTDTAVLQPWAFDLTSQPTVPTVVEVTIPFGGGNDVTWTYDETSNRYLRSQKGRVHEDRETGQQLSTRNLLVFWARTTFVPGKSTRDIVLDGSGRATLFRDGNRFDATWYSRNDGPPELKTDDGTLVELAPGNTWIEVIATDTDITTK